MREQLPGLVFRSRIAAEREERIGVSADRLLRLIRGAGRVPLSGIVSGSLDVDKLDYLSRDARNNFV